MSEKKYLVISDFVISNNGEKHFISADKLIELYRVNPEDCIILAHPTHTNGYDLNKYLILRPRYDGDYSLPEWRDA